MPGVPAAIPQTTRDWQGRPWKRSTCGNTGKRPIGKLSGGQRQRVFIARALAADPQILFMDEPTASVDKEFQTELYDFLKELNTSATVVVVSHDLSVLVELR